MVELVDTLDSKSNDSNIVPVQVRPWAPKRINRTILVRFLLSQIIKIMIKYQEDYSDKELASFLNLTIDEIKKNEIEILSLLKRDENLKLLKMSKNDN